MSSVTCEAAECYVLEGIGNKDFSKVPLDPNVVFRGPLQERGAPLRGIDALRRFLEPIYPLVKGVRILSSFANGDEACVEWELELNEPPTVIPILEYFRVSDGRLVEIRPFYDPRPLVSG